MNKITLKICKNCETVQYPPREICKNCLSDEIISAEVSAEGKVISLSNLYHSLEEQFIQNVPFTIGSVQLKNGAVMIVFLAEGLKTGQKIRLENMKNALGEKSWHAVKL